MKNRLNPEIGRRDLLRVVAIGAAAASTGAYASGEAGGFPDSRLALARRLTSRRTNNPAD